MNTTKTKLGFLFLMLFSVSAIFAQSTISGTVNDQDGVPLGGVNIVLEGTSKGAVSDFDGNYSISNVENGTYNLKATFIGYKTFIKSVTVSGASVSVNFTMTEDAASLDEIVVTGVVNPKSKLESSVSVSTLDVKLIEQASPRSAGELFRTSYYNLV